MKEWRTKLAELIKNPKVQKSVLTAASYYAGAHGGPAAADLVHQYGPQILAVIAVLVGG